MDKLGSIVFNFHSFVSADDFGSEINSSQSEGMCILLFKIQRRGYILKCYQWLYLCSEIKSDFWFSLLFLHFVNFRQIPFNNHKKIKDRKP